MTVATFNKTRGLAGSDTLMAWVELIADGTIYSWAGVAMADASTYHGGYKEARVLSFGAALRELSDWDGQLKGAGQWTVRLSDLPDPITGISQLRNWMALTDPSTTPNQWMFNRHMNVQLMSQADWKAGKEPITVARGLVLSTNTVKGAPFTFEFTCQSAFGNVFNRLVPGRLINEDFFPNIALPVTIANLTRSGGTATLTTLAAHLYATGDQVRITGCDPDDYNGTKTITVTGGFTFTFPIATTPVSPATTFGVVRRVRGQRTVTGLPEPVVYGDSTGAASLTPNAVNRPAQWPALYVDDVQFAHDTSVTWARLMVAGHAMKAVTHAYYKAANTDPVLADDSVGTTLLIPAGTGWATWTGSAATYKDITVDGVTRRYTFVYAHGPWADEFRAGTSQFVLDVQGVEDVGDGSGNLLTDIADQYLDCLRNVILDTYLSGARLGSPNYPDGTSMVDDDSFDTAKNALQLAYPAGVVGVRGLRTAMKASDLVASLNRSADLDAGINGSGQFRVVFASDLISPTENISDVDDILMESFGIEDRTEELANNIPWQAGETYTPVDGFALSGAAADDLSIQYYDQQVDASGTFVMEWLQDQTIVDLILAHQLQRRSTIPRYCSLSRGVHSLSLDLGDVVAISSKDGYGPNGWDREYVQLRSMTPQVDQGLIECRALRLNANIVGAITMADNNLGGSNFNGVGYGADGSGLVYEYRIVRMNWSLLPPGWHVRLYVNCKCEKGTGESITPYLERVDDSSTLWTGSAETHAWTAAEIALGDGLQTFTLTADTGTKHYRLWYTRASATNADVYAWGILRAEL